MKDYLKIKQFLGLAKRSGNLITGESLVLDAVRKNKAKIVFIAKDASANTQKKFTDKTKYYNIPSTTILTSEDIAEALGVPRKIVAITDVGFAKKFQILLKEKG